MPRASLVWPSILPTGPCFAPVWFDPSIGSNGPSPAPVSFDVSIGSNGPSPCQFHLTFSSAPTDHAPRQLLVVSQRAQTGFPRRRLTPLGFGGSAGLRKSGVAAGSARSCWHTKRDAPPIAGEEPGAVAVKLDFLEEILKGGAEKMREADCAVVGGHSIADDEIKFGYAVTGTIHPARVKANAGARAGDALIFTKRLGTGVISTALKRGMARDGDVAASIASMLTLNRKACEAMLAYDVHGCTDVTGFGLIGHAREMALASGVTLEIEVDRLRFLDGALQYARLGAIPGGLKNNREYASCAVETARDLPQEVEDLLYDPQTSGGLLITLPEADAAALAGAYPDAYGIGRVLPRQAKPIRLI